MPPRQKRTVLLNRVVDERIRSPGVIYFIFYFFSLKLDTHFFFKRKVRKVTLKKTPKKPYGFVHTTRDHTYIHTL